MSELDAKNTCHLLRKFKSDMSYHIQTLTGQLVISSAVLLRQPPLYAIQIRKNNLLMFKIPKLEQFVFSFSTIRIILILHDISLRLRKKGKDVVPWRTGDSLSHVLQFSDSQLSQEMSQISPLSLYLHGTLLKAFRKAGAYIILNQVLPLIHFTI